MMVHRVPVNHLPEDGKIERVWRKLYTGITRNQTQTTMPKLVANVRCGLQKRKHPKKEFAR